MKLFDRSRKGIAVRHEAQGLLKHIEQMDRHAGSLEDAITRRRSSAAQVVHIATMEGIASGYLVRCLPALRQFGANVKIELVSIPQAVDLNRKEADIFLRFFNPDARGLKSSLFGKFSLFLYCSKDYLRQHGIPRSREDLDHHVFVGYIDDLLAVNAVRWLDEVVAAPMMSFHSNSVFAQCNAAVSGLGIALLPTFVGEGVPGLQRILSDKVSVQRDVWVSVRTDKVICPESKPPRNFSNILLLLWHMSATNVGAVNVLGETARSLMAQSGQSWILARDGLSANDCQFNRSTQHLRNAHQTLA